MDNDRRDFLSRLAVGAAVAAGGLSVGAASLDAAPAPAAPAAAAPARSEFPSTFDMSWLDRVRGRYRAVFDSPKIADGGEMFRAAIWRDQIAEAYGAKDDDITAILVFRHTGIPLVMDDEFWMRHQLGKKNKFRDYKTKKFYEKNPIRSSEGETGADAMMASANLETFVKRGGIVLGCNFAFGEMVSLELAADKEHKNDHSKEIRDEARKRTLAHLLPGVILQPSGFFAVLEAQRAGCQLFTAGE